MSQSQALLERLSVKSPSGGILARPTLSLFLYSKMPVQTLAARAADAIAFYVETIGIDKLVTVAGSAGQLREFTPRKLARDLAQLRKFPASLGAAWVEYDSDPDGWVGEYGLYFYATDFEGYEYERESVNLLRVDFPHNACARHGVETLLEFVTRIAVVFGCESGNAGLTFKRTSWTKGDATAGVNRLLPRFLAFDPCYSDVRDNLRGHTTWAHWINLLGSSLTVELGGSDLVANRMADADVRLLQDGTTFIRNADLPPAGDSNRQAPDIGLMPACAALMRPLRVQLSGLGDRVTDVAAWLSRFDAMKPRPWKA